MAGRASRRGELGQHFLAGGRLAAELVGEAGVGPADLVVEIGAGTGVLTEALARRAGRVLAVECDPRLAAKARGRLAGCDNVAVVTADALRLPLPRRPFRVLANLPFGSTEAILRRLPACFSPPPRVSAAVLVVRRRRPPLVPVGGRHRLAALLRAGFREPETPLRRSLVPPLTRGQLRRLARDLDFPLDARAADLDAGQWAGILAFLP